MRIARAVRLNQMLIIVFTIFVPLEAHAAPAETVTVSDEARVRAEIMPLFDAMQAAANVYDAEAHLAPFLRSPDLTFLINGRQVRGWDNLLAQQKQWWAGRTIESTDKAHQPYQMVEGPAFQLFGQHHAMVTFVLDARRVYPEAVMRRPLAISQLWEKRPEGWKIVYAHESVGPERPEP